jgi:uncharacterized Zn finger protein
LNIKYLVHTKLLVIMISFKQKRRLDKVNYEKIYVMHFEEEQNKTNNLVGKFHVKNSVQKMYEISFFNDSDKMQPTFKCSCPDNAKRGEKDKIVCKHICYMYLKVGRFFDLNFFRSNKLRKDQWGDMLCIARNLNNKNEFKEEYTIDEELRSICDDIKLENVSDDPSIV